MPRNRSENASFVVDSIKKLGLEPHPESRIMQEYRVLTQGDSVVTPNHPQFQIALEAERDMQLLGFVFDHVIAHDSDTTFLDLVHKALKDRVLPQDNLQDSRGRDAQFHLFIAAICYGAGFVPVQFDEPDLICTVDRIKFGIAAKRLKNVDRLEEHIRKASEQIRSTGLPGIIALDTCVALNRDNRRIAETIPDDQFRKLYKQALDLFIFQHFDNIQKWVKEKGVRGIVIHDHQVRSCLDQQWELISMTVRVPTKDGIKEHEREFDVFSGSYVKALSNLEYL